MNENLDVIRRKHIENAVYLEKWKSIDGKTNSVSVPIFDIDDLERAETIIQGLEGLTIESAQELLQKINRYLLQYKVD